MRALTLDSEDPLTQNDLGVALAALGQPAKARDCFERALKLVADYKSARANLADLE